MRVQLAYTLMSFTVGLGTLAACGAGRQHQQLGTGRIAVAGAAGAEAGIDGGAAGPAAVAPGAAGAVALSAPAAVALPPQFANGEYRVRYQIWLPRAMEVQWTLECGEHEQVGSAGETFAAYQTRRVGELQAERQREREKRAQVGSLVGGAVLGVAQAGAAVQTPTSSAQGTVTVDGAAAGAAAGAATVTDAPIVLASDDLGQGYRQGEARFWLGDAGGSCAMSVAPSDPADAAAAGGIAGTFSVERWYNAKRVEQQRIALGVNGVRGSLHASLIARGADPTLAARRREEARLAAEARAEAERVAAAARAEADRRASVQVQLEADARLQADIERARRTQVAVDVQAQAEVDVRVAYETHIRNEVYATRERWYVYLGKCGANPHRRDELRAEEERRAQVALELRLEQERRARIELELRMEVEARRAREAAELEARRARAAAELEARRARELAELHARRTQMVIDVRATLRTRMIALGADADVRARLRAQAIADAEAINARAAAEYAAFQAIGANAAAARGQVIDALLAMGARLRPPMPPPVEEYAGVAPSSDASWHGGHWTWNGSQWMWIEGRWVGGGGAITVDIGGSGVGVGVRDGAVGVGIGVGSDPHGGGGGASWDTSRDPVRDHRTPTPPAPPARDDRPQVRDHRAPTPTPTPPADDRPKVRDHRTPATTPAPPPATPDRPKTRDHRDDKKDDKDSTRPRTRDHR